MYEEGNHWLMDQSNHLYKEAVKYIPGGVNSPVRAFGSIGSIPRFIKKADGAYLYDEDGKRYIDYIGSWGPMILGHNHPEIRKSVVSACENGLSFGAVTEIEVRMAKLICELVPSVELVRMVNSGTEGVMSAIRAARGFTGRDKIIKFSGCYHGHSDGLLVKAGSGAMTACVPDSLGVPKDYTVNTLSAGYNDLDSVEKHFNQCKEDIAAIIVEPVAANMGVVLPEEGFLEGLRVLCDEYGAVLIFDEVITGFRLGTGGAQEYYHIKPDLTVFGKIIGAGMPVGAYGGRKEIMEMIAPLGGVYQAGTLSGNPVAMAAGFTQLSILKNHPEYYRQISERAEYLYTHMQEILDAQKLSYKINHIGSLGCMFFTEHAVKNDMDAKTADTKKYADYCNAMLAGGVYLAPAQFEAMFVSAAHTMKEIERTLEVFEACMLS